MQQFQLQNKMAEARKSEVMSAESQRVLSEAINAIPNPAFFKNTEGVFIGCNRAFSHTILGTTNGNIVGRSIYDLPEIIPQVLRDVCAKNDENLLNNPGIQAFEITIRCAGGMMELLPASSASCWT